jgi:hypothetical protein
MSFFPGNTPIRRAANGALLCMGRTDGAARLKEISGAKSPAWAVYHRAGGQRRGRHVFTVVAFEANFNAEGRA